MHSLKRRTISVILSITAVLCFTASSFAQEASAEFISQVMPAKLKSGEQATDGIKNIFFHDQKLYVTNIWTGLQIIDVSDVNKPKEVGSYIMEYRTHNCFVYKNKAFLASELSGVTILDVQNPAAISKIGNIETEGDATYVVADSQYAYVAEETYGVKIYDIRNVASPIKVGVYDTPGYAWGLFLDGDVLYVADKSGGLIILDVSNPTQIKRLGQFNDMRYAKTVQVENEIAYVSNGADGLWIFDVRNKAFPKVMSTIKVDGYVYDAFKAGNSVFLSNETKKQMDIINVTDPLKPKKEGEFHTESKVYATWKNDVYVYIAADTRTIIVRHNHPPLIAQLQDMVVDENVLLTFVADGSDQDGDAIYYNIVNLPEGATFDTLSGAFSWTPTYDQSGLYPDVKITVFERTESRLSNSTTFNITVNHVNRPPTMPDVADGTVDENSTITFTLEEGSDPDVEDKGRLVYKSENMPMGAAFDPKTRTFTWTPTYEQSGIYTVDFIVEDPPGLVMRDGATITVNHIDRKPTLVQLENAVTDENSLLRIKLEGSDPDKEDQNLLSYRAENLPQGAVFNADSAVFSWTPTYDQSGEYKDILFIFTAGKLSDSTKIDITVNHVNRPPVLETIAAQNVNENDTLKFVIKGSDPDVEDSGKLVYSADNLPSGASFDAAALAFTWKPNYEQSGAYNDVSFSVKDPSGLIDSKQVSITVNHVNRSPQLEDVASYTIDEDSLLKFSLSGSDPDIEDQDKLVYSAEGLPEGAKLNGTDFEWKPTYDQSGSYAIIFKLSDGNLSVTRNSTITVIHVNRPPAIAEIVDQNVNENSPLKFVISGSDPDMEDQGKLTLSAQAMPEGATFDAATGTFSWTPTFEQSGEYPVTFVNTDPQGASVSKTVKIVVNHVNRTPEFPAQTAQVVDENMAVAYTLTPATDPDKEDEGKLVYTASGLPEGAVFDSATLTLNWTPTYDQSGQYTITFSVKDSEFKVDQPLIITVNHVNRVPEIAAIPTQTLDENKAWSLQINASDPDKEDSGKIKVAVTNLPQGAVFDAATNTISWTPTFDQSGNYNGISATVTDPAGLNAQQSFDIVVNHVNRPPQLNDIPAQSVSENNAVSFTVSGSDPDTEDQGKLTYSAAGLPQGAVFEGATFNWTPTFDQSGDYTVTINMSDGTTSVSKDVVITVENVNRDPQISGPASGSVEAGSNLTLSFSGSDPDNDNLNYEIDGAPSGMSISNSGALSWTPAESQTGSFSVTVKVSDGSSEASAPLTVTVTPKPQPAPTPVPADTTGNN